MKLNFLIIAGLFVLAGLLQFRMWSGEGSFSNARELETRIELKRAENHSMRQRNAVLKAEITDLRQGTAAVEEKARSELGLIRKEDETFYLLVED